MEEPSSRKVIARETSANEVPPAPLIICTLPTYNEAGNILLLCRELLNLGPNYQVIVIDDDSPDGTWRLVHEAAASEPRLSLIHRTIDRGRGRSGRDGFVRALKLGADIVVEMDADFSHRPHYVPAMVERLREFPEIGLVLGSRGVQGGEDAQRGTLRRVLTWFANLYIRTVLGLKVRDCNSGFRCWRRATLERIAVEGTFSVGPAIVQELLYKTHCAGVGISELPIEFMERSEGESTLTLMALVRGYTNVMRLRWLEFRGRL